MSRYQPPDSGGDPRRSPRDGSPARYNDQRDSGSFNNATSRGSDGQSRSMSDSRMNSGFGSDRERFRDLSRDGSRDFTNRDPPRGPKALTDIPSGPRANSFSSEYRGRGRARGRGWRDDSRDGGREMERDYRERREERGALTFRDDRGRGRDWVDRDRRDSFRGRRPSPPGRDRSPVRNDPRDIRDRRDSRDLQINPDADRSRRDSREGPPSIGSTSSELPMNSSAFSYGRGYTRGRGRGRGDWEPRGRGRGYFDEVRDRARGRSRSPERERDSSWHRNDRPLDSRDDSQQSIRVVQARDNQSPPPQAPEVPAFGSILNPSVSALTSPSPQVAIPTGPRSQQSKIPSAKAGRGGTFASSAQWIRPGLTSAPRKPDPLPAAQKTSQPTQESTSVVESTPQQNIAASAGDEQPIPDVPSPSPLGVPHPDPVTPQLTDDQVYLHMMRKPLDRVSRLKEEGSDSESGDEIDDSYFEVEKQKVRDRLARMPLHPPDIFFVTSLDSSTVPNLFPPIDLGSDGDEPSDAEKSDGLPTPATKPRMSMDLVPDDGSGEETDAEALEALEAVRPRMKTPPLSSLPFGPIRHWDEDEDFLNSLIPEPGFEAFLRADLAEKADRRHEGLEKLRQIYKQRYRDWILFHRSDDPIAVRCRERWEGNRVAAASRAVSVAPAAETRPEGRRAASRFATEHDMEMIMKQSELEAREQRERSDRAAKAKAASEKEAVIPDMKSKEEIAAYRYGDRTNLIHPDRAIAAFEVLPPIDDFTEWECETWLKVMLEYPKQWGRIAAALPGRNFKHCIQHYYQVKHPLGLKEMLAKKTKGKKKNRGAASKPKSNALIANLEARKEELEEGQDIANGGGERRRPRRAAAPTFAFETAPSESDTAPPAPTPGRRGVLPKADAGIETGTGKRKGKTTTPREKGSKQAKGSQLLAAAPNTSSKAREEEKALQSVPAKEWPQPQMPTDPSRYMSQWEGTSHVQTSYPAPHSLQDKPSAPIIGSLDMISQHGYSSQERLGSMPPAVTFDSQQPDRRNIPQTSSYWSVPEQTEFPALLTHFGTDWAGIAKWMGSKTHIMVYTTVFQQWLTWPSDTNKSRSVANVEKQVKNYYSRQIDSGRSDLEEIARIADEKRARGESTGPAPTPSVPIKRRYDGPGGSLQRPLGSAMDGYEDMPSSSPSMAMQHAPSPQPAHTSRFPALAQANPLSQTAAPLSNPASTTNKQQQAHPLVQQMQQSKPSRGPPLGYFNNLDRERPILQAATPHQAPSSMPLSDPIRTQRSHMVAHEAQLERQQALRLEEQQRAQQQVQQQQLRFKQETENQNLSQYEQYTTQTQASSMPQPRNIPGSPIRPDDMRRTAATTQYLPRNFQTSNNLPSESVPPTPLSSVPPAIPRTTMSAPPIHQEQPAPPRAPAVTAVRQQETVRKTSSIMSLLNDEPSEPTGPKRASEAPPAPVKPSPSPAPQQQMYQQTTRPVSSQPAHIRRESSLGDVRSMTGQYPRTTTVSQAPTRLNDSPYSASTQSQPPVRQQVGPSVEPQSASEREYYSLPQYMVQHQQNVATPSQLSMPYQPQQSQQSNHRQHAFGQPTHNPTSLTLYSTRTAPPSSSQALTKTFP